MNVSSFAKEDRRSSALLGVTLEDAVSVSNGTRGHYEEIIASRIPYHHGTLMHNADHLLIAEFPEAPDAVNCAIDMEERFAQYNKLHLDDGTIVAKIGIHFGDVYLFEGKQQGYALDVIAALIPVVPVGKIYVTRDLFVKVKSFLPLKFENVGKKSLWLDSGPTELLSVGWETITGNLQSSLKKLEEDHSENAATFASKLGLQPSKKISFVVMMFIVLFLFLLFKFLKRF